MRIFTIVVSCVASLAVAQPHKRQHQHAAKHHEIRNAQPVIEWVTEYEYTTEVIPVTTTIWVTSGFIPPIETPTSSPGHKNTVPAQFYEPIQKPASTTLSSSTTSVEPAPAISTTSAQFTTSAPLPPAPPATPSTAEKSAQPETPVSPVEAPSPKAPETTPTITPQTQAPSYVAPVKSSEPATSSSSGSSTGPCSVGNSCTGDMTHYEAGLGACGWESDGSKENVVALSHIMMGTQSNGNPFCGKSVTVKLKGKSIVAKVVDKCMGCEIHAIDLSDVAFAALEDMGVGRTKVEWYFN